MVGSRHYHPEELATRAAIARMPSSIWGWYRFRFESSLDAVETTALLVVVGTTGTTNLPRQIGERASRRALPTLVINPEPNAFSELVRALPETAFLQGTAGSWVPHVAALIRAALPPPLAEP